MTIDELIVNTATFLINQKQRCTNLRGCIYAAADGNHCAIGSHMPQGMAEDLDRLEMGAWDSVVYAANREVVPFGDLFTDRRRVCKAAVALFDGIPDALLSGLQSVHDTEKSRDQRGYMRMLKEIAGLAWEHHASDDACEKLQLLIAKVIASSDAPQLERNE